MQTELQRLLKAYEDDGNYADRNLFRAIVARLDAAQPGDSADLAAARVRIDELEATLDGANRKIVATLQERDEAREDSAKRGEAMTRLSAALSRAEAALAEERKLSDEFRAACPSVVGEDRAHRDGVRACFFGDLVSNRESKLAIACLWYDSRRAARTNDQPEQAMPFKVAPDGPPCPTCGYRIVKREPPPMEFDGATFAAPSSAPPAPPDAEFARRVERAIVDAQMSQLHPIDCLARKFVKAEDEAKRLREALEKLDKEPMMYWSEQKAIVRAALSAEPRK